MRILLINDGTEHCGSGGIVAVVAVGDPCDSGRVELALALELSDGVDQRGLQLSLAPDTVTCTASTTE